MLIRLENIFKIYGEGLESEVRALDGVSLTIDSRYPFSLTLEYEFTFEFT